MQSETQAGAGWQSSATPVGHEIQLTQTAAGDADADLAATNRYVLCGAVP